MSSPAPIMETERLLLRHWSEDDADDLFRYACDPAVGPIAGWPPHKDRDYSLNIIRTVLSGPYDYAVCLKSSGSVIGCISLISSEHSHTDISDSDMEAGFWMGRPFWGNGYMTEALSAVTDYAFGNLGCRALWCGYYDGNAGSRRVQDKCGFIYHHTEFDKPCQLMGDKRTEHWTRITRDIWSKRKAIREKGLP